jgi:hypothetical protein
MKTARMAEIQRLYAELGSKGAVARELGLHKRTVQDALKRAEEYDRLDPAVSGAMSAVSTGIVPNGMWIKTKPTDDAPGYSVYLRPEQASPERLADAIREALEDLDPPPAVSVADGPERCVVFPLADLHIGLLTDLEETGEDWNSKKALTVFDKVFSELVDVSPHAERCIIAQLGDLTHTNDQTNQTQKSKHQLDADTRYFMILRRALAAMKSAIEIARRKYPQVTYVGRRGNHDLDAHVAVSLALGERYSELPSVEVVQNASDLHVEEYGRNMLILHHGDRVRAEQVAVFVPAQWPDIWGRTKYRLALSGHLHHQRSREIGGLICETVGTMIPRDAYAVSHGYWSQRALVSITLDKDRGEISRARVPV